MMVDDAADRPPGSRPRQLIVCCDGTNNTLTAGNVDTNVVKLQEFLVAHPSVPDIERVVYYDPGVGSSTAVPPAGPIDWLLRSWQRLSGLASGQGIFENIGEAYLFLMRSWRDNGDRIYCFGFSRGAFTARCVVGMVNLFGIVRPEHEALVPMLVHIYFSPDEGNATNLVHRMTRTLYRTLNPRATRGGTGRQSLADQVRMLFASDAGKVAEVYWVGVWDTVEAVGLPGPLSRKNPNDAFFLGKHVRNVRHVLSFDEHRWTFEPRLYEEPGDIARDGQTLKQRWFHGAHCDVGGGYRQGEAGLSDRSLQWMIDEVRPYLDLVAEPHRSDAQSPSPARPRLRHDAMWEAPFWALAGMRLRNMRPMNRRGIPIEVIPGPASEGDGTVWATSRKAWPLAVASIGCLLCAAAIASSLAPSRKSDVAYRVHLWEHLGEHLEQAARTAIGFAAELFASIDGGGFFAPGPMFWDGPWDEPGWAAFWLIPFTLAWGYLLARIASRAFAWLAGERRPDDPQPVWVRFGMAPFAAVASSIGVALAVWSALALHGIGVESVARSMVWFGSVLAWASAFALIACIPFACVRVWIVFGSKTRYLEPIGDSRRR